jgi:hypothetical protein
MRRAAALSTDPDDPVKPMYTNNCNAARQVPYSDATTTEGKHRVGRECEPLCPHPDFLY